MNYIGIDLGTSAVKIIATDSVGKIISEVTESYPLYSPHEGWSEQNPEDWYNATMRGLKRLNVHNVAGISFGGQMHGLVILDKDDKVIRPCILWNDGRTEKETNYLNSLPVAAFTGNMAFAGFTAPKLLWVKENEPENFVRIAKIMLPKDYLVYKFTGRFSTDYSDASGMLLLDVKNKRWSADMCRICGIDHAQLPELIESYEAAGKVKKELADLFGWNNVAVAAGAGDNAAAAIGMGCVKNGSCNISLGTSGTLFIASDKFCLPANNALHSFAHADGRFHLMGCILSAASANEWWIKNILDEDYGIADGATGLMGQNPVMFLPYLSGERCPHNDVSVRGAFVGLSHTTAKEQMSLAVLEGVAFALRDCLELAKDCGICVKAATVCGGGANSKLWLRILANTLNVELFSAGTEQGPAYGTAILAMVVCGEYNSVDEAVSHIVTRTLSVSPDKALVSLYDAQYGRFKALYPCLKEWSRA